MTIYFVRPLGVALLSLPLAACAAPVSAEATSALPVPPVLGVDLGGAPGRAVVDAVKAIPGHAGPAPGIVVAHSGHARVQDSGAVTAINAAARTITVKHAPIAALGWPSMTMDFPVGPAVDLQALRPGMRINFTIEHGEGDRYVIQSLTPAGGP